MPSRTHGVVLLPEAKVERREVRPLPRKKKTISMIFSEMRMKVMPMLPRKLLLLPRRRLKEPRRRR